MWYHLATAVISALDRLPMHQGRNLAWSVRNDDRVRKQKHRTYSVSKGYHPSGCRPLSSALGAKAASFFTTDKGVERREKPLHSTGARFTESTSTYLVLCVMSFYEHQNHSRKNSKTNNRKTPSAEVATLRNGGHLVAHASKHVEVENQRCLVVHELLVN